MPRGGSRPGAGRKKKAPETATAPAAKPAKKSAAPVVDADGFKTDAAPPNWPFGKEQPPTEPEPEDLSSLTPLDFLLGIVRDPGKDERLRIQAATIAAPYCHPKKAESKTKGDEKPPPSGRFSRRQPPQLVAAGGKKV